MPDAYFGLSPPYFFEAESLTEPGAHLTPPPPMTALG